MNKVVRSRRGPKGPKGPFDIPHPSQGRDIALQAMDTMLARSDNIKKLQQSFQDLFDASPVLFFKDFVMPLLPKQTQLDLMGKDKPQLQIILTEKTT